MKKKFLIFIAMLSFLSMAKVESKVFTVNNRNVKVYSTNDGKFFDKTDNLMAYIELKEKNSELRLEFKNFVEHISFDKVIIKGKNNNIEFLVNSQMEHIYDDEYADVAFKILNKKEANKVLEIMKENTVKITFIKDSKKITEYISQNIKENIINTIENYNF